MSFLNNQNTSRRKFGLLGLLDIVRQIFSSLFSFLLRLEKKDIGQLLTKTNGKQKIIFTLVLLSIPLYFFLRNNYGMTPRFSPPVQQLGFFNDPNQLDTTIQPLLLSKYSHQNRNSLHQTSFQNNPTTKSAIHFVNRYSDLSFFTNEVQSFGVANTKDKPIIKGSTITYPAIFPDTDLKYTVNPNQLLEEFVVWKKDTALQMLEITQTLDRSKITSYKMMGDGSIDLYLEQELVATIPRPVMYEMDDKSVKSYGLAYKVEEIDENTLLVTKVIDEVGQRWLASKNRTYPIVIDLVIDNADTAASWVSSSANTVVSQETTIKQEGTGSVKITTSGGGGGGTDLDMMEYATLSATGGTISYSGGYTIHTFNSSGTFTPNAVGEVEALVVGGGGGGGGIIGGGGGGGGVVYSPVRVTGAAMTVTVGAGGTGGDGYNQSTQRGSPGSDSSFGGLVAVGGGGGSAHGGADTRGATTGGSGGGGAGNGGPPPDGGDGIPGQGYDGGYGNTNDGGGGGGAGEAGEDYGAGGDGIQNSITGSSVYYGGGGGGGGRDGSGDGDAGGLGGGGAGTTTTTKATDGTANTGGGGGAGGYNGSSASQMGGDGGSGVVIIRYLTANGETSTDSYKHTTTPNTVTATGGTVADVDGFRVHTFTTSGTFTPNGAMNVESLIVAGGGGGGGIISGGGGAGGVLYTKSSAVTATGYTVTVGGGGTGGVGWNYTPQTGTDGSDSSFNSLTAVGGGGGGGYNQASPGSGGSGGGGSSVSGYHVGAAGTAGQGYAGGNGGAGNDNGGGGGGAGGVGQNAVNASYAGDGGPGKPYRITGRTVYYGGGGGGGTRDGNGSAGSGGIGGGGDGTSITARAEDGEANTGGGGGAGGYNGSSASQMGGNGGTGVVIIRYPLEQEMPIGGMVSDDGDYRLHTFRSLGEDTFVSPFAMDVEVLVVGGGGGGGETIGGGGGGGGVVHNTSYSVSANTSYSVTVGEGGSGGSGGGYPAGVKGGDSIFGTITAIGGGAGGGYNVAASGTGGSAGGNGGGGGARAGYTVGQGYDGGNNLSNNWGGGAGGAGEAGDNATSSKGGDGGDGYQTSISGTSTYYGGGGGGGVRNSAGGTVGYGGQGGGGNGGISTAGVDGSANTGGGGGGGGYVSDLAGGSGGSGIIIVKYLRPAKAYSEDTIKTQGSYAIRGVANAGSLNHTLTKTVSPTIDLSNASAIEFDIRSTRTGSNIKIGIHDSGGTTSEFTPNITSADVFQSQEFDISGVSNADKDAIDQIIITIVNADSDNTFYIDNMTSSGGSVGDTVTLTKTATNLSENSISLWVRSDAAGSFMRFQFGETVSSEQTFDFTINSADTWENKLIDITSVDSGDRDQVTKFAFSITAETSGAIIYFDDIQTSTATPTATPTPSPTPIPLENYTGDWNGANSCYAEESPQDTSITLHWTDNSSVEIGYEIDKQINGGADWQTVDITSPNAETYHDDEVTTNTVYRYRVRSVEDDGSTGDWCGTPLIDLKETESQYEGLQLEGLRLD